MGKNPDYTASAINLSNPPEVAESLSAYGEIEDRLQAAKEALAAESADRLKEIRDLEDKLAKAKAEMLKVVQEKGSYQDIEAGIYAVLSRMDFRDWDLPAVKELVDPKFHPAVIQESVNGKVLTSLLKGGDIPANILDRIYPVVKTGQKFIVRAYHPEVEVGNVD